jgi:hypothetical protein
MPNTTGTSWNKGIRVPPIERILSRTIEDPTSSCWIFQGSLTIGGYGRVGIAGGKSYRVTHRVTYEHFIATIPDGLELDHLCRVRACCNPWHLEPVTHAENCRRAEAYGERVAHRYAKTHCKRGHPYSGDNLKVTAQGTRKCRTCTRDRDNAYWRRRTA